ncbi:MAG: hypothetical protein E6238_06730 [Streptococcus sp.]|uniref:hypothetical protein n=1 Tax=Streptococcus TaxID=1301 RepID=UPI001D092316|nr:MULTISPECIES: hypothetical protein [Streptococcus]MCB7107626.1 hypothetical protein [Streptococcus oralis]MCQ5169763.1 hypothetical protein [Streptococcus oralis]MDU5072587.1 hypothetical protein [Streptococcus sp.]
MFQLDNLLFVIQILEQIPDDNIDIIVKQMIETSRRTEGAIVVLADLFKQMSTNQRTRYFTSMAQYLEFQEKINILDNLEDIVLKTEFFDLVFLESRTKIFLFDVNKSNFDKTFSNVNYDGFQIYGLSDYTKTWILDSSISNVKDRTLAIHKVVNLDLNILQFFNKFSQGRLNKEKQVFKRFLSHFKENGFEYNISTAMLERSKKTFAIKDRIIWKEIVGNYLRFTRIDSTIENYPFINLSEEEKIRVEGIIASIGDFSDEKIREYDVIACLVCKAFLIKMDRTIKHKIDALLKYSLDVLNVYLENELVLLDGYFKHDEYVSRTFKKIEGISKDTQSKMLNTIWDIFHIRLMEWMMYSDNKKDQEIYLHYFSSHDKAFEELLLYNPLKMFVIHDNRQYAIRKKGIGDICKNEYLLHKLYTESSDRIAKAPTINFEQELENLFVEITNLQKKKLNSLL